MLKKTEKESENYIKIKDALDSIKEVTSYINSKKKEFDNIAKMIEIQSKLGRRGLVTKNRKLIFSDENEEKYKRIRDKDNSIVNVKAIYLFSDLFICIAKRKNLGTKVLKMPLKPTTKDKFVKSNSIFVESISQNSFYYGFKL
jgi:hypothetical protein